MPATTSPPPTPDTLTALLRLALRETMGEAADRLEVVRREPNHYGSTFPSEFVVCRVGGREVRLFCKRSGAGPAHRYGHRSGVAFEAAVYRRVLGRLPAVASPRCYGSHVDGETGEAWLCLEDLGPLYRVGRSPDPRAMEYAAHWAGAFHAAAGAAGLAAELGGTLLRRYDADYYGGWAARTLEFSQGFRDEFPWLPALCARFGAKAAAAFGPAGRFDTVIHGEYYPANVLVRPRDIGAGEAVPVDWESAAVAPGEIDLASLTEFWPDETVQRCVTAYARARWPGGDGPDAGFARRLDAARLYLQFRWLGNRPEWTADPRRRCRFDAARAAAARLGLV